MKAIANNPKFIKPNEYDFFKVWLGNSLVITHGDRWHKMRKLITPAFHFQTLERFIPIFEDQTEILLEKLRGVAKEGETVDAFPIYHAFALDVVSGELTFLKY